MSPLASDLRRGLRVPVMAGPMFIASTPDLVIAQCRSGIIGAMPALNARSSAELDEGIARIQEAVGGRPFGINLVAHRTNVRLEADLAVVLRHKVPIVVLALAANGDLVRELQANGILVLQDVVKDRHARKCAEMGVDGIVAVGVGAGGHTGALSPFALVTEIRQWWDGPLLLGGAIATGAGVLAAEALGADLAYVGTPFLACSEAATPPEFRRMIVDGSASDIVTTNCFTGVDACFLRPSLEANGLDPELLTQKAAVAIDIAGGGTNAKAWRDIWSAGQGIGAVRRSEPASAYVDRLVQEYDDARRRLALEYVSSASRSS